jgi:hypothetical protein
MSIDQQAEEWLRWSLSPRGPKAARRSVSRGPQSGIEDYSFTIPFGNSGWINLRLDADGDLLVPSMNFFIGRAFQYTSIVRFIMWLTDIVSLEGC